MDDAQYIMLTYNSFILCNLQLYFAIYLSILVIVSIQCVAVALLSSVFVFLVTLGVIQWIRRRQYKIFMTKTLALEKVCGLECYYIIYFLWNTHMPARTHGRMHTHT